MRRSIALVAALVAIAGACAATVGIAGARGPAQALDEASFHVAVRPMFQKAGCAGPSCHGSGLIGLRLSTAGRDDATDLAEALKELRAGDPTHSPLYTKALGARHLGGRTLAAKSCEANLLGAWIRGRRDLAPCPERARPAGEQARGELPAALRKVLGGCGSATCHGGGAAPYLLDPERPGAARVDVEALTRSLDTFMPSRSRLLTRLLGAGDHPRTLASTADPAYREIYAWIAGEPAVLEPAPSYEAFARDVQPLLERRACTSGGCHGSRANDLILLGTKEAALDNYLRIVPRIRSGLFPAKPRNQEPHGGGLRLGTPEEDCASATIAGWVAGTPPVACRPRGMPDRARFAAEVQPALEKLTCPSCHSDGHSAAVTDFHFVAHPDAAGLESNYQAVMRKIDLDYPPASSVLLRVREDCSQARILSWIDRRPNPGCTVELKNFRGSFPTRQP